MMSNPRDHNSIDNRDEGHVNDVFDDESSISSSVETLTIESGRLSRERSEIGLTDRLTETLVDNGYGDLLIQRSDREDRLSQWIQALDVQVMGACRADERLKPFLKMNGSGGVADDGLLAHLSQHFEPVEVGILARCFCVPLVSVRVGKINKQGTLLCPTAIRGNLNLTLLPTSDLRLSFNGDDGNTERLITLSSNTQCSAVVVDEISADTSGRSFFIQVSDGKVFYFWCSEKSKLLGNELLAKMKDIIKKKPSIAELTGISKSRLDCFATQLRVYLVENSMQETSAYSLGSSSSYPEGCDVSITSTKSFPFRGNLTTEALSQQGGFSPTSSSFEGGEGKLEQREDSNPSALDSSAVTLPCKNDVSDSVESATLVEVKSCPISPSGFLESLDKLASPPTFCQSLQTPTFKPTSFSPYYCWCPQAASTSEYPVVPQEQMPASLVESPLLPPLSTLLSSSRSASPSSLPPLGFPTLLPDPIVRLPLPSSQQILTFTPLMCDPIVHVPVIDVCSSGQGYLVSAGPAIRGTIPPLHPKVVVNPLIPETDPVVEKGARETLQLLISGLSQGSAQFTDVLPSVLTGGNGKPNIPPTGSRGLYCGSTEIYVTTNNTDVFSLSGSSGMEKDAEMRYGDGGNGDLQDQAGDAGISSDDGGIN